MSEPTNVVRKQGRKVQFYDGAGVKLTMTLVQDVLVVAYEGTTNVEAMHREQHLATPISVRTKDGKITGAASFLVAADYDGTAAGLQAMPYTWMTWQRAQAAGLATTLPTSMAVGGSWAFGIRVYDEATNSTKVYKYCMPEKPTDSFANDLLEIKFAFTDLEEDITVASGDLTL
jgi:hypothetical protein